MGVSFNLKYRTCSGSQLMSVMLRYQPLPTKASRSWAFWAFTQIAAVPDTSQHQPLVTGTSSAIQLSPI